MRMVYMFFMILGIIIFFAGLSVVVGMIKKSNRPYKDENLLHNDGSDDNNFKGFNL